ncbi:MAG: hypothetical protein V1799_09700 [bacterium]
MNTNIKSLAELRNSFNREMQGIPARLSKENRNFQNYTADYQSEEIKKAKSSTVEAYKSKVNSLATNILNEKKNLLRNSQKVKYPNLTNGDTTLQAMGEAQVNSALLFLSTPHTSEAITKAIQNAFDLGRNDFAFTLIENILSNIPRDISGQPKPSETQKGLIAGINEIVNSFKGNEKLEEIQSKVAGIEKILVMIDEFKTEVDSGVEYIRIAGLAPYLSESERAEMLSHTGKNLTQEISFKVRASEAMQQGAIFA